MPALAKSVFSRKDIQQLIDDKKTIILAGNRVYDLTKFADHHPGGILPLIHANGKDATDLLQAFHPPEIINKKLEYFYKGTLVDSDEPSQLANSFPPSVVGQRITLRDHLQISQNYRKLDQQIRDLGFYNTDMNFYYFNFIKLACFFATSVALVLFGPNHILNYIASAFLMATFWHQGAFVAHDAGHNAITHQLNVDHLIGLCMGNFMGGISIGWWKKSHYVHHIVTNEPEHDPDIQHLPFLAVTNKFFNSIFSSYHQKTLFFSPAAQFFVSLQHYLYYPIMALARFNLYIQSFKYLTEPKVKYRSLEWVGLIVFWIWFSTLLSRLPSWWVIFVYVLISHAITLFLHLQITLSHFAMSTERTEENEAFAAHQLRTTMDVDCPEWFDWFHGGLQFQAIHHLFPRLPRHNLRKVRPLVQEFCQQNGLKYTSYGFIQCNTLVLGALEEVAKQLKLILEVAQGHTEIDKIKTK